MAQETTRRFTVADDIGLTSISQTVKFSPDGRFFVALSERGRLDLDRPESSLRVYRTEQIHRFVSDPDTPGEPSPSWTVCKSSYKDGPNIADVRWLPDSRQLAFLAKTTSGNDQLFLADIERKTIQPLTPEDQHVTAFDIRSSGRFIYTVLSPAIRERALEETRASSFSANGRTLSSIIFEERSIVPDVWVNDLSELWAVLDGKRFRVVDPTSGHAIPIHLEGLRALALSPDGRYAATALSVSSIPREWESLYRSPVSSSPYRITSGHQDPDRFRGQRDVSEYVLIDLTSGKTRLLVHAPIGDALGWWGLSHSDWSGDGQSLILADTFLPSKSRGTTEQPNRRPCVAVYDLATDDSECLDRKTGLPAVADETGWQLIYDAHFASGNKRIVIVQYMGSEGNVRAVSFKRLDDGSWSKELSSPEPTAAHAISVSVKQSLNAPPVLVATENGTTKSRVIWNPNARLKSVAIGTVSVVTWQDKTGRDWVAGLYEPPDYVQGKRYPLVIQTHGFNEQEFSPSGSFSTAFAAQELAAAGFMVLQVRDCPIRNAPEEGRCQVAGYESAVERLSESGLVDPERVGIIGFSRTCYYVLEALTASTLQFKAASITDGVNEGYLEYLLNLDTDSNNSMAREAESIIGASPFGPGLLLWLAGSPEFNMGKVAAPLQVVATRRNIFQMWEPYAALRYLNKPVELIVLNSDEHILTNPAERAASQSGTIDWFRFWLQDYEDPDPAKYERYQRWEAMRGQNHVTAR